MDSDYNSFCRDRIDVLRCLTLKLSLKEMADGLQMDAKEVKEHVRWLKAHDYDSFFEDISNLSLRQLEIRRQKIEKKLNKVMQKIEILETSENIDPSSTSLTKPDFSNPDTRANTTHL